MQSTIFSNKSETGEKTELVMLSRETREVTVLSTLEDRPYIIGSSPEGFIIKKIIQNNIDEQHTVYLLNARTMELEKIVSWEASAVGMSSAFVQCHEGSVYFVSGNDKSLFKINLGTKEKTTVTSALSIFGDDSLQRLSVHDGKLLFDRYTHGSGSPEQIKRFAVSLKSGEVLYRNLVYTAFDITSAVNILAENNKYFLVCYNLRPIKATAQGPNNLPYEFDADEPVYGLIKKTDFWSGSPDFLEIK